MPEAKRKFWPTWAVVFVSEDCVVVDVIQYYERPEPDDLAQDCALYPNTTYFYSTAGETYTTLDALVTKLEGCRDVFDPKVQALLDRSHMALKIGEDWKTRPAQDTVGKAGDGDA